MARKPAAATAAAAVEAEAETPAATETAAPAPEYVYSFDPEDPVDEYEPLPFEDADGQDDDVAGTATEVDRADHPNGGPA